MKLIVVLSALKHNYISIESQFPTEAYAHIVLISFLRAEIVEVDPADFLDLWVKVDALGALQQDALRLLRTLRRDLRNNGAKSDRCFHN